MPHGICVQNGSTTRNVVDVASQGVQTGFSVTFVMAGITQDAQTSPFHSKSCRMQNGLVIFARNRLSAYCPEDVVLNAPDDLK